MTKWPWTLRPPFWLEALVVAAVAAVAMTASFKDMNAARERGTVPYFYQGYYEPAIRVACGQPFEVDQGGGLTKEMSAFLKLERETLSCDSVRPSASPNANPPTRIWYHLFVTAAALWKVTGVSWSAIDGLAAAMMSLTAVFVYGMFRLWMPMPLAAVLAIVSILPGLKFLLFLRDIGKAPFILASLMVAALLVSREMSRAKFMAVMGTIGLWLGVGYGFRPDVLIGLPLLAVTAIAFRPGTWRETVLPGILGTGLMAGAFVLAASPIFSAFTSNVGSCHWHFSILGLSDTHTSLLGLAPGNISWLAHYDDLIVWRSVESYAERVLSAGAVGYCTPMYDQVSKAIYLGLVSSFPADFLTRAMAAAWHVIGFGFWGLPIVESGGIVGSVARSIRPLIQAGWIALWAMVLLALLAKRPRLGLFACFALAYLCAYPIVQFDTRHYYHLAFLAWVPVGLLLAVLVRNRASVLRAAAAGDFRSLSGALGLPSRGEWFRALAIFAGLLAAVAVTMVGARLHQDGRAAEITGSYLRAPGEAASGPESIEKDGTLRVTYPGIVPSGDRRVEGRMLRADVGGAACATGSHELTIAVSGPEPGYEFKKKYPYAVAAGRELTAIFVPVYFERLRLDRAWIELPAGDRACLAGVRWLDSRALPALWVGATVPGSP